MRRTQWSTSARFGFAALAAVSVACGSNGGEASKSTSQTSSSGTATGSTTTSSGVGGQGASVPSCGDVGTGGSGGGGPVGVARLGLRPEPREDDEATIVALGGKPFPAADPDRATKNAYLRVELGLGAGPGKTTKLRLDHQYRALGDPEWPTAYDAWTVGNGRELVLSVASSAPKVGDISYCELAGSNAYDLAIADAAKRLRGFVEDNKPSAVDFAWGHTRLPAEFRPKLRVLNSVTFEGNPTKVVVETRKNEGVVCAIPKGTPLVFRSPDGTSSIMTIVHADAKVGDYDISLNAQAGSGTISPEWTVTYQTPAEYAASYVAAYKKVRAAMKATWGTWSGQSKVRFMTVLASGMLPSFDAYWPGDDEVDVIGVDALNVAGLVPKAPWLELESMLYDVRAFDAKHGSKDIVVTTTGTLDGPTTHVTAPAVGGSMVGAMTDPLPVNVPAGTDVYFYDDKHALLAQGKTLYDSQSGSAQLIFSTLSADVPAGATALLRLYATNKAKWIERAHAYTTGCAPEVKGILWYTGTPGGFWLDQGPEAAPDVLDAFRAWAQDPYFGG